jgi:hypothetical protein
VGAAGRSRDSQHRIVWRLRASFSLFKAHFSCAGVILATSFIALALAVSGVLRSAAVLDDGSVAFGRGTAKEARESIRIQSVLARIGATMRSKVWPPTAPRCRLWHWSSLASGE